MLCADFTPLSDHSPLLGFPFSAYHQAGKLRNFIHVVPFLFVSPAVIPWHNKARPYQKKVEVNLLQDIQLISMFFLSTLYNIIILTARQCPRKLTSLHFERGKILKLIKFTFRAKNKLYDMLFSKIVWGVARSKQTSDKPCSA